MIHISDDEETAFLELCYARRLSLCTAMTWLHDRDALAWAKHVWDADSNAIVSQVALADCAGVSTLGFLCDALEQTCDSKDSVVLQSQDRDVREVRRVIRGEIAGAKTGIDGFLSHYRPGDSEPDALLSHACFWLLINTQNGSLRLPDHNAGVTRMILEIHARSTGSRLTHEPRLRVLLREHVSWSLIETGMRGANWLQSLHGERT